MDYSVIVYNYQSFANCNALIVLVVATAFSDGTNTLYAALGNKVSIMSDMLTRKKGVIVVTVHPLESIIIIPMNTYLHR